MSPVRKHPANEAIAFSDIYKQNNRKNCALLPYKGILKAIEEYEEKLNTQIVKTIEEELAELEVELEAEFEREMKELQSDFDLLMKSLPNGNEE